MRFLFGIVFLCGYALSFSQPQPTRVPVAVEQALAEAGPIRQAWVTTDQDTLYTFRYQAGQLIAQLTPFERDEMQIRGDSLWHRHTQVIDGSYDEGWYVQNREALRNWYHKGVWSERKSWQYHPNRRASLTETLNPQQHSWVWEDLQRNRSYRVLNLADSSEKIRVQKRDTLTEYTLLRGDTLTRNRHWEGFEEEYAYVNGALKQSWNNGMRVFRYQPYDKPLAYSWQIFEPGPSLEHQLVSMARFNADSSQFQVSRYYYTAGKLDSAITRDHLGHKTAYLPPNHEEDLPEPPPSRGVHEIELPSGQGYRLTVLRPRPELKDLYETICTQGAVYHEEAYGNTWEETVLLVCEPGKIPVLRRGRYSALSFGLIPYTWEAAPPVIPDPPKTYIEFEQENGRRVRELLPLSLIPIRIRCAR